MLLADQTEGKQTMPKFVCVFIQILLVLTTGRIALASNITLETTTTVTVDQGTANVLITVINKGDEPAYNVRIQAEVNKETKAGPHEEQLNVNSEQAQHLAFEMKGMKPGRYPMTLYVDYTDRNQYPSTALSVVYVDYQDHGSSRISGEMKPVEISERGRIKIKTKNLENTDKNTKVRLVLPKEFSGEPPVAELKLPPGGEETLVFEMKNLAALPGSRYPIYAVIEYDDEEYHYANAVSGMVTVLESQSVFTVYQTPLIAAALVLIAIVIYLNVRRKRT